MRLLATTNLGTEDLLATELEELGFRVLSFSRGRVVFESDWGLEETVLLLEESKLLHKAFTIEEEVEVKKALPSDLSLKWVRKYLNKSLTFAVRAQRTGEHEFTSQDLAKLVGSKIVELTGAKVNLDVPNVVIVADVVYDQLRLGVLLLGEESQHRRYYRVLEHMASLKPSLAQAMLKLAEPFESLLDPMCGSGTIAIEGALSDPHRKYFCFDIDPHSIRKAVVNAAVAGVKELITFGVTDVREISRVIKRVDVVVSNPPYGIRMGSPKKITKFYREMAKAVSEVTNKVVMITPLWRELSSSFEDEGFSLTVNREVLHGDLYVRILVLERRGVGNP